MSRKDLEALGVQRESLNNNPLLIQAEVGKVRRRCITLPPSNFTYGIPTIPFDGGVAEAVGCWKFHRPSCPKVMIDKDFMALNRKSIMSGLTTAHEQQQYRATHDIKRRGKATGVWPKPPPKIPEGMTFGISTRPSTPIYNLLEHKYQTDWLEEQRQRAEQKDAQIKKKQLRGKVYETRASLLRRFSEPVDPPPLWKMRRWKEIPAELQTFRSDKARSEAFMHHTSDAISRTGVFGHGIYQAAKS